MRYILVPLLVLVAQLPGQQPDASPEADAVDPIQAVEQRLERVEKAITQGNAPALSPHNSALETRLSRIEARLDRLERSATRPASGSSGTRLLESRLRALEREVSRLRR